MVSFFPTCPAAPPGGTTLAEVARNAGEALSFHLEGMAAAGERIPEPGDFDAPLPDWLAPEPGEAPAEPVRLLVPVEAPGRAVRVNISMDEGLVARLDAAANRHGMSRSAFLAEAVRSALVADRSVGLCQRNSNLRPRRPRARMSCWRGLRVRAVGGTRTAGLRRCSGAGQRCTIARPRPIMRQGVRAVAVHARGPSDRTGAETVNEIVSVHPAITEKVR